MEKQEKVKLNIQSLRIKISHLFSYTTLLASLSVEFNHDECLGLPDPRGRRCDECYREGRGQASRK